MKYIKYFFVFLFISMQALNSIAQDVPDELVKAFKNGNADELSSFFAERFQLIILGVDHRISKSQATEIMRDFFKKYPPESFEVPFKGDKKNSNYAVGRLKTDKTTFRINMFFKIVEDRNLIHYMEIDKENETGF